MHFNFKCLEEGNIKLEIAVIFFNMLQKVITVSNGAKSGKPINFNYIMEASNVEQERLNLVLKNTALESFWSTETLKTRSF